ncbi:MAG: hypothetical protein ACOYL6_14965 [Bacteriovoracaceae bacterium]
MKFYLLAFLLCSSAQSFSCEFTTLKVKVKVESRTLNYGQHKEIIKTEGRSNARFVKNETGDYSVLAFHDQSFKLDDFSISEKYDYYTTRINANINMTGETVKNILKEVIGEKKLAKRSDLKKYFDRINTTQAISLSSYFYAFHGSSYAETDDETSDALIMEDSANKENKLIIGFNFKRYPKCR